MLIQRISGAYQTDLTLVRQLLESRKQFPNCFDEVWLSTHYGYPKFATHQETVKKLVESAKLFREAGVKVSLQISNTLGHGQYMSSSDCSGLVFEGSTVGNMVGYDGIYSRYSFCYNDRVFRDYIKTTLNEYAIIKPDIVWFDDDLRFCWHDPVQAGCFCDNCIAKFNKKHNFSYTRKTLVEKLPRNAKLRFEYLEFMKNSVGDFVEEICQSFHELSPNTNFGHQNASVTISTGGNDYIFSRMKKVTGKNPAFRPGGGAYNDVAPWEIVDKYVWVALGLSLTPDYVDYIAPEIENLPSTAFGSKSARGTCFETSLYLAGGATYMSYAMLRGNEALSFYDTRFRLFSQYKKYWEKLVELNKNTRKYGINFVLPRNAATNDIQEDQSLGGYFSQWFDIHHYTPKGINFLGTGIPYSFGNTYSDVNILRYPNAKCLSKDELESLLEKPCLCDAKSFVYLSEKYDCFNAKAEAIPFATGHMLNMKYVDDCIFPQFRGKSNPKGFLSKDFLKIIPSDTDCIPLSEYITGSKELQGSSRKYPHGIAECIVKTSKGGKWAIFGSDLWNPCVNSDRKDFFEHLVEYLSGRKIKARISNPQPTILLPRENNEGYITSVSIVNASLDELEAEVTVRNPIGENFFYIDRNGEEKVINATKCEDGYLIKLPELAAWNLQTIIIK